MKRQNIIYASLILVCVALMILFYGTAVQAEDESETPAECCFVRTGYQGVCHVTPGEGETCESILEYLNTPETIGKSYCGGNKLRGGWQLVDCETAEPPQAEEESTESRSDPPAQD